MGLYIPTIDVGFEWEIIWEHMRYSGIITIQPTKWWYNGNIWDIISNIASWEIPELNFVYIYIYIALRLKNTYMILNKGLTHFV